MKKLLINCLSVFIIISLLLALSPTTSAETLIEDIRNSVVRIVVFEAGTSTLLGVGSGFVVGDKEPFEYIATCAHVVDDIDWGEGDIYIWRSRDDLIPASVHVLLYNVDLALLKLDPQHLLFGYEPLELARRDVYSIGDAVYAVGFPAIVDWSLSDFPAAYPEDATVTSGVISRFGTFEGASFIQMDAAVSWGSSGGPLVNDKGQVIGIVSRGAILEGINGAIQIEYLTDILTSRGIAFKPAIEISEPVVPAVPEETEPITQPVEEEVQWPLTYFLLAAAAAIILIIVVLLVLKNKKQKAVAASTPQSVTAPLRDKAPAVTQAKRVQPRPVLKGVAGTFAGQILEFVENQIVIGRDPRLSQLIYPPQKEEISRKHCTIRFDSLTQKFVLVDTSSNGTFLSSKQKLEPGEPYYLNAGDRFYLADPNEVFEVRLQS
jgi:hypothetical protein